MEISRRLFGLLAAASISTFTLPAHAAGIQPITRHRGAIEETHPIVTVVSRAPGRWKIKVAGSSHHANATALTFVSDSYSNLNFGKWRPGMPAECPTGGEMNVTVHNDGTWSFSGSFPIQANMPTPCRVSLGIGLRSSTGKVVAFTESGVVTDTGWTFEKSGKSSQLGVMWKAIAKGHDFTGSWIARQIPRANHQPPGGGSGTDVAGVLATISDVLGVVAIFM